MVEVGVFSSASTSLTPFFLPLFLGFLSLSLFWSFSLFSLFLLSDLGTQFLLISWILKPVRTPVAILGSLGVCIYVPASCHWLISYSPIHLT